MQLIHGSAHDIPIPDQSVQMIVTSPPYWGLRKYAGGTGIEWPTVEYSPMPGLPPLRVQGCEDGCSHEWGDEMLQREQSGRHRLEWETGGNPAAKVPTGPVSQGAYCLHCGGWRGELGLEPDPTMFIAHLILCLREWRRVLRDDGICFVNLGDSYANDTKWGGQSGGKNYTSALGDYQGQRTRRDTGLKPKDLVGIPWRFAFAAQADGWWLRSAITWCKSAPMPESVRDRPTKATEQIFLLAKSESYYYDAEAVREKSVDPEGSAKRYKSAFFVGEKHESGGYSANGATHTAGMKEFDGGRNMRDWQIINPQGFPGSHFAVFPSRIPEIAILAGTSARGCCPRCGKGWVRVVERTASNADRIGGNGNWIKNEHIASGQEPRAGGFYDAQSTTTGWAAQCTCDAGDAVPCVVLDPFSGSGTTGKVAARLGRDYIGVDVSEEYLTDITAQRFGDGIQMTMPL